MNVGLYSVAVTCMGLFAHAQNMFKRYPSTPGMPGHDDSRNCPKERKFELKIQVT
jgi:hypothetical protein